MVPCYQEFVKSYHNQKEVEGNLSEILRILSIKDIVNLMENQFSDISTTFLLF